MNKKEKRAALKSVLTNCVQENRLIVVDELKFDAPKTKDMVKVLESLKAENALVVLNDNDKNTYLSGRNIDGVKMALTNTINVFDVLNHKTLVLTKDAAKTIEEVYA
jgi:large subunit ribosomal protein L4